MTLRLSAAEVIDKYAPSPDPRWSVDIEAAFLAKLNERHPPTVHGWPRPRKSVPLTPVKTALLREYATGTLKAQRMNDSYLTTLSAVLANIASAERGHSECTISQRDDRLGPRTSLRNIQAQMVAVEVLTRVTRAQGYGFVGDVFVYRSSSAYAPYGDPAEELERSYRSGEGEADFFPCLSVSRLSEVVGH